MVTLILQRPAFSICGASAAKRVLPKYGACILYCGDSGSANDDVLWTLVQPRQSTEPVATALGRAGAAAVGPKHPTAGTARTPAMCKETGCLMRSSMLIAVRPASAASARETPDRMLQSVAEVCVDEGKSGVP